MPLSNGVGSVHVDELYSQLFWVPAIIAARVMPPLSSWQAAVGTAHAAPTRQSEKLWLSFVQYTSIPINSRNGQVSRIEEQRKKERLLMASYARTEKIRAGGNDGRQSDARQTGHGQCIPTG